MAGCEEPLNLEVLGNQGRIRRLASNKPDQVFDSESLVGVATVDQNFRLRLFVSILFASKRLFFPVRPAILPALATVLSIRQNLHFGCRPRQRRRPLAFAACLQPSREVRQRSRWVPGG